MYKTTWSVLFLLAVSACISRAVSLPRNAPCDKTSALGEKMPEIKDLEDIMVQLKKKTDSLRSYQAKIYYLFIQDPELLDSRTLRKGDIFYKKDKKSNLRINFNTFKQDQSKEQNRIEQYAFDGVWLIRVDHQLRKADYHQQAEKEKPLDVFEFINRNFPLIGFTKTDQLSKDFSINWVNSDNRPADKPYHLKLEVKKDSKYKKEFVSIDFYIDPEKFLPARIVTESTEEDIYDITFSKPVINKNIPDEKFKIDVPGDFTTNIHPLKKQDK